LPESSHAFAELRRWLEPDEGHSLYAAKGCPACYQSGYAARTGVFEVLRMSQALRQLIVEGQSTQAIRDQALREGLIELRQAAMLKVAQGHTTAEEVVRAVPSEYLGLEE
jgi:type II secretory ATPase GspE/PulE/Tfp pilus assembly ATPase PilB-like protein